MSVKKLILSAILSQMSHNETNKNETKTKTKIREAETLMSLTVASITYYNAMLYTEVMEVQ